MSSLIEDLGHLVKRAQHRQHRDLDARLASLQVSLVQWNALREIDRHPGSSQHRLAELTFNSDQAFGALLARLVRLGLVERCPGPGRAIVHRLTESGNSVLNRGRKLHLAVLSESFAPLDEAEQRVLSDLLKKLFGAEQLPVRTNPRPGGDCA